MTACGISTSEPVAMPDVFLIAVPIAITSM
jgi:hypothetical protein